VVERQDILEGCSCVGFAAEGLEKAFRRVWTWDCGFEAGGGGAELRLVETGVSEELRLPKGRAFVGAQRIGKLYLGVDTREGGSMARCRESFGLENGDVFALCVRCVRVRERHRLADLLLWCMVLSELTWE
jgi:hypothetical protein